MTLNSPFNEGFYLDENTQLGTTSALCYLTNTGLDQASFPSVCITYINGSTRYFESSSSYLGNLTSISKKDASTILTRHGTILKELEAIADAAPNPIQLKKLGQVFRDSRAALAKRISERQKQDEHYLKSEKRRF